MRKVSEVLEGLPLWKCDHCGGPALWTFNDGDPFYHCERQCDGFMQMELWGDDGVEQIMRGGDAKDAGRSTSDTEPGPPSGDLPF